MCIYTLIKFALVVDLIVKFEQATRDGLPMDYYYFIVLCLELGFCVVEFVMACFSRRFMRALANRLVLEANTMSENNLDKKVKVIFI